MSDTTTTAIRKTLLDAGRVTLPGFGTLRKELRPVRILSKEQKLLPPSSEVTFDQTHTGDADKLYVVLSELSEITVAAARKNVSTYVTKLRQSLNGDERADLPGVGHFLQRHDGQIEFVSSQEENFNKRAVGLPAVAFTPIRRAAEGTAAPAQPDDEAVTPQATPTDATKQFSPSPQEATSTGLSRNTWYAIATVLIVLGIWAAYGLLQSVGGTIADESGQADTPRPERQVTNNSGGTPADDTEDRRITTPPVDARSVAPADPPRLNNSSSNNSSGNTDLTANAATSPGSGQGTATSGDATRTLVGANSAIIAIGMFTDQEDVDEYLSRIRRAGFTPWVRPAGRDTRVGVEIKYDTRRQRSAILEEIRERVADQAVIMLVNGRYVLRSPEE